MCALSLSGQVVAPLARQYRESPTPARRDALLRIAAQYAQQTAGALALLAVGVSEVEQGQYTDAVRHLEAAEARLPEISDYLAYHLGLAYAGLARYGAATQRLDSVAAAAPFSPLAGRAAVASSKAHLEGGAPQRAIDVLLARAAVIPQPEGDLALAQAHEAAGTLASAASYGQRVYFGYPGSKEAEAAQGLLGRMRQKLGQDYPPALPGDLLARAGKWLETGNYARARKEYETLVLELGGAGRELAQVRAAAARLEAGAAGAALEQLKALSPSSPEADAERLFDMVQCARRLENREAMAGFLDQLRAGHTDSEWRLNALMSAGNYYLLRNDTASYVPLFRACYEGFPAAPRAEYCHWKVAWNAYFERRPEAAGLLREYLGLFPQGDRAAAALYFLGEYREVIDKFPNSYYVELAAEKLGRTVTGDATRLNFEPGAAERRRIRRAQLLYDAGLTALADGELRFAARGNPNAHILAMELARQAGERNRPDQGIRHIKGALPGYLSIPLGAAPLEFWRLAFPLPYRAALQQQAKLRNLDPYLLAGLIRQESEFTADAVSRAGARGLMQVMPVTGRQLANRLKTRGFRTASLFNADLNIQLGTLHLRDLVDQYGGSLERALAAYNAGKTRADEWLTWGSFREPAEFVESIPITETRTYVQAVLRNAWMYRRIYTTGVTEPRSF